MKTDAVQSSFLLKATIARASTRQRRILRHRRQYRHRRGASVRLDRRQRRPPVLVERPDCDLRRMAPDARAAPEHAPFVEDGPAGALSFHSAKTEKPMKILLLILLAVPATSAIASTQLPDAPRAVVRYDDLNLRTSAGAAALRSRIDRTVVRISGGDLATIDGPALADI
ncbi:MAG: UrcA family protein, partial [Janthinobacterium lividum]